MSKIPMSINSKAVSRDSNFTQCFQTDNLRRGCMTDGKKSLLSHSKNILFTAQKVTSSAASTARKSTRGVFGVTPRSDKVNQGAMSASHSGRRSSVMADRRLQRDERPLSEKSYHDSTIKKLILFLNDHNYPHIIQPKFMVSPTKQDVIKIFEFLFEKVGLVEVDMLPLETKVLENMRLLNYPFFVNKSSLISFSTRQALGSLLGMIDFLLDIVIYEEQLGVESIILPSPEGAFNIRKETLKIILQTNDESERADAFEDLARAHYGDEKALGKEEELIAQLEEERDNLELDLEKLNNVPIEIEEYRGLTANLRTYIEDMHKYIEKTKQDALQSKEKNDALDAEKKSWQSKLDQIKSKLAQQMRDIDDIQMERDIEAQLNIELEEESNSLSTLKKNTRAVTVEMSKRQADLSKIYADIVSITNALKECFHSSTNAEFCEPILDIVKKPEINELMEKLSQPSSEALKGISNDIADMLHDINIVIVKQLANLEILARFTLPQEIQDLQSKQTELQAHIQISNNELLALESEFGNLKTEMDEELQRKNEELEKTQKRLTECKVLDPSYEDEVSSLQNKLESKKLEFETLKEKSEVEIKQLLDSKKNELDRILITVKKFEEAIKQHGANLKTALEVKKSVLKRLTYRNQVKNAKKPAEINASKDTNDTRKQKTMKNENCENKNIVNINV